MIQLTVMYGHPDDAAAFDRYYQDRHAPLALQMPGLRGYSVHKPASLDPNTPSPYYLIADLYFESMEALSSALQSEIGQQAAGDLANFATGGAILVAGEVQVFAPVSFS